MYPKMFEWYEDGGDGRVFVGQMQHDFQPCNACASCAAGSCVHFPVEKESDIMWHLIPLPL